MLAVAMAFAACWGVLQLAVLGWGTRSVRVATLLVAVGAGAYGCGVLAVLLELGYTRALAALTGEPVAAVVTTAGYTVDPFVEEFAKVAPLVVAGLHLRTRRQWGLTDHLLVGAAIGAGFGLLEAVLRFAHRTGNAVDVDGGWLLPTSLAPPMVPSPAAAVTSWLPAPVHAELLGIGAGPGMNLHLAWTALAGLGVGLWFRLRGPARWAGPVLVLLAGADHAASNYDVALTADSRLGDVLAAPFVAAQPLLGLWVAVGLAVAVVLDVRVLRAARAAAPSLRLRREGGGLAGVRALTRYARLGAPWTAFLVLRFVLLRRAALYGSDGGVTPAAEPMLGEVADVRARMDVADHPDAWRGVGLRSVALGADAAGRTSGSLLRRYWPVLLWAALLLPAFLYFVVGTTPLTDGVQDALERPAFFPLLFVIPAGFCLVLLAWQVVAGLHGLPGALRLASGELPAVVQFRVATALGASLFGVLGLAAWLTGTSPSRRLLTSFHVLDALDSLLLAGGLALMLAAFLFFPPSIGLSAVVLGGGATVLVPTVAVSGGFTALSVLGLSGVLLSQAVGNSGGGGARPPAGGGQSVPDLPRTAPPPKPAVHHWRLRRIVDDLWRGTGNPSRVGDGTTMDAVRNEVLTGRPTYGRFHLDKARQSMNRLTNWLDEYGSAASRTDRQWAWRLRAELARALRGQ
jgi:hypothetical protein